MATPNSVTLATTAELIAELRAGRMIVLMDDEDRENEGDLVMAASCVRAQDINFMARYGRGLICLPLTQERCEQLRLPLMVADTHTRQTTNFTVSIEAAQGITTGISAADRATTIHAAVAPRATPADIRQPGHVFPLIAQRGGVLTRAGHTEAGCDLARLAGFEPAAVIVEILNEDGSMARRPDLEAFAAQHGLKLGTIADLIQYRLQHEQTVERLSECPLTTRYGDFRLISFQDLVTQRIHFALVRGTPQADRAILVRVHIEDPLCDLLHALDSTSGECGMPFDVTLRAIAGAREGVALILRQEISERELARRMQEMALRHHGQLPPKPLSSPDLRTYGLGAQILRQLGVGKMHVLGSPRRMHGLSGFGLEVVDYVTPPPIPN